MKNIKFDKEFRFQNDLLNWWKKHKRDFPWRRTKDPYKLLIAEILLRKTTAEQVLPVYLDFINKYPTPEALNHANVKDLENLLKPLGMHKTRAQLLKKFASSFLKLTTVGNELSYSKLIKLPGIGTYSANAVLSLIYNKCVPMLDTNFIRILNRVFNIKSSKTRPRNDPYLWEKAQKILPCDKAGNFNLAVLDFATLICKHKQPKCNECFAQNYCSYSQSSKKSK